MVKHCYWSVCEGEANVKGMARSVASARRLGVKEVFRVFSERPVEGAQSYALETMELAGDRRFLAYLKAGASGFEEDYLVWLDSGSEFRRAPGDVLRVLAGAPVHVPLSRKLRAGWLGEERRLSEVYSAAGLINPPWRADKGFWVIKKRAIETVCRLAAHAIALGRERDFAMSGVDALGFAAQMLCGNPRRHRIERRGGVWNRIGRWGWRTAAIVANRKGML